MAEEDRGLIMPFGGSPAAERLLRQACRTARRDGAQLDVLCVVALPPGSALDETPVDLDDQALRAMVRAQQICREEGVVATFELNHAPDLADAVFAEARRSGAMLIFLSLESRCRGEPAAISRAMQTRPAHELPAAPP